MGVALAGLTTSQRRAETAARDHAFAYDRLLRGRARLALPGFANGSQVENERRNEVRLQRYTDPLDLELVLGRWAEAAA
jgi:hypothetical protein